MHLSDIITAPWAIMPSKLLEIQAVYSAHLHGEKIDISAVEARLGKTLSNESQGYTVNDGVAVIPIHGVIAKRMNLMSQMSGGSSTQLIARDIKAAIDDQSVNSILLHIDSPGGAVDGTQTLADIVRDAGTQKPVMAYADGTMASAAYWIGSAASEIVASSETTQIGSIGVVTAHKDVSKAEEQAGYKTTEISAGKYKRIASQYAPLDEEGAAHLQEKVDQLYTIFVDAIAENRGVDAEIVLEDMADGRVFLAQEAKQRNMIDHIASLETTILNMATGVWPMKKAEQIQAQTQPGAVSDISAIINIETLKNEYPEIVAEIMQEGAKAERARINAIENAALPGHEALVASMKFDGKSTAGDVALAIVDAEKKMRADHLQDFNAYAPQPVPHAATNAIETYASDDSNLPIEDRAKAKWDADASVRSEFSNNFNAYLAYEKASQGGKIRVLGGKK